MSRSRIRYYERIGLIDPPERESGWRRYEEDVLRWLGLIDATSRLGFTLAETRSLLEGLREGGFDSGTREELIRRKIEEARQTAERAGTVQRLLEDCLTCGCLTRDGEGLMEDCLAMAADEARTA